MLALAGTACLAGAVAAWPHLPSGGVNAALLQSDAITASGVAGGGAVSIDALITGSVALMPGASADRTASGGFARAAEALAAKDYSEAFQRAAGLPSKAERLAIQWTALYFGGADLGRPAVASFFADTDGFPVSTVFQTRLEQALLREKPDAKTTISVLGGAMPATLAGQIALAEAYVADGQNERASRIAQAIWVSNVLDADAEKLVRARVGTLLTAQMHWDRAVYLMMHDRASAVERIIGELSPAQRSLATARNAVSRNDKDAKKLLDSVDPSLTNHPVFLFSRAQRARQFQLWDDAIAFLDRAGPDVPESAEWWYERRLLTRQLLAQGDPGRAYKAAAGYTKGPDGRLVDAQFHAGWIALSFLDDAKGAAGHFAEMAKHSTLPDTITQSNYWLARAEKAAGNSPGAKAALERAAAYSTVFYGQLARDELGQRPVELRPMPDVAGASALFEATDRARAVRLLAGAGQSAAATVLLRGIALSLDDAGQMAAAARMAQSLGAHNLAIQIAETAESRGMPLDLFSFPRDGLPTARLADIDHAAVYAVTRQESRFQIDAISVAGARGLMQLMPGTARETAEKVGEDYSPQRLTSDGAYNALLGSTYLADQLRRFDGSLLLASAAYNAGAGNVNKWIAAYGDPRQDNVDPVVWIELIPFLETRRYVQRVLGNYLVYRARLGGEVPTLTAALRRLPG